MSCLAMQMQKSIYLSYKVLPCFFSENIYLNSIYFRWCWIFRFSRLKMEYIIMSEFSTFIVQWRRWHHTCRTFSLNAQKYAIEISFIRPLIAFPQCNVSTLLARHYFYRCFVLKFAQCICLGLLGAGRILRISQNTYSPSIYLFALTVSLLYSRPR